jgi:hypothetical protein
MLGHSSETVTSDVYVHTVQAARARVAETMADALWGHPENPDECSGGQLGGQLDDAVTTSAL